MSHYLQLFDQYSYATLKNARLTSFVYCIYCGGCL